MEKGQAVEECKQQVPGDWKYETEDMADCIGSDCLEILWHAVPGAVRPCQERGAGDEERLAGCTMVHDAAARTRRRVARRWVYKGLVGRMLITVHEKKMRARSMDCTLFGLVVLS